MARATGDRPGDEFYNARRRYYRAAQRYMDKADKSSGATAERYRRLARKDLDKALETYDKGTTQKFSRPIQNLANVLGIDLSERRKELKEKSSKVAESMKETAKEKSTERLAREMSKGEVLRQEEAKAIFGTEIGQRIIGGLVEKWRDKAVYEIEVNGKKVTKVDKEKMMQAIFDYLKVDNLADALEKIEKSIGKALYESGDTDTIYESVKLTIQTKVADNTLVA